MALRNIESRLEKIFDRTFSKGLRSPLQPVEMARRISREVDLAARIGPRGRFAPNEIVVHISSADAKRFEGFEKALPAELTTSIKEYALEEGYDFVGPVSMKIVVDPELGLGEMAVRASFTQGAATPTLITPTGDSYPLGATPITMGRGTDCNVVIGDTNASRRHAELWVVAEGVAVRDLNSTNGTWVNGRRITQAVITPRDDLTIGTSNFRIELA